MDTKTPPEPGLYTLSRRAMDTITSELIFEKNRLDSTTTDNTKGTIYIEQSNPVESRGYS